MSRGAIFWGLVLVIFGSLFLLQNLGIINFNVWQVIGPTFLILFGVWILFGSRLKMGKTEKLTVPLQAASSARVEINYGAGRLDIGAGSAVSELLEGEFDGGVEKEFRSLGNRLEGKLSLPFHFWPFWMHPGPMNWKIRFNTQIPLLMVLNVGAAESNLDFTELIVNELILHTGASATTISLPAHAGISNCSISAGAAGVKILVPQGVAARIRGSVGLGTMDVNRNRFSKIGEEYSSADFDAALNKVDIKVESGLGSVEIQ